MTPAALRAALASLLADQLGTYTRPDGSTTPAIHVGDPQSDWSASGLEVRIEPLPEVRVTRAHAAVGLTRDFHLYLIPRDSTHAQAALERLVQAYETTGPVTVPAIEGLGILQQYSLHVRS